MTQAFSNENLRKCIVAWMVSTDTPFSAVEHVTFKRLVLCASNLKAHLFSSRTAKRELEALYQMSVRWVKNKLLVSSYQTYSSMQLGKIYDKSHLHRKLVVRDSKLSFTTDVWTSLFRFFPYTGITVHWIDENWEQQELGLALSPIDGPHTGENLSEAFIENVDHRFRIFHKVVHRIFTITINFP